MLDGFVGVPVLVRNRNRITDQIDHLLGLYNPDIAIELCVNIIIDNLTVVQFGTDVPLLLVESEFQGIHPSTVHRVEEERIVIGEVGSVLALTENEASWHSVNNPGTSLDDPALSNWKLRLRLENRNSQWFLSLNCIFIAIVTPRLLHEFVISLEFLALTEKDSHTLTAKQWLTDPFLDVQPCEIIGADLVFWLVVERGEKIGMAWSHLPKEWQQGLVSEDKFPVWLERSQLREVLLHQFVVGYLVGHPLLGVIVEQALVGLCLIRLLEGPHRLENTF